MAQHDPEQGMDTQDKATVEHDVDEALRHPSAGSLLALEDDVREAEELAPVVVRETKAGYKTTEFWFAIVTSGLVAVDALPTPTDAKGIVVVAVAALYAIARGLAKKGVGNVGPEDELA